MDQLLLLDRKTVVCHAAQVALLPPLLPKHPLLFLLSSRRRENWENRNVQLKLKPHSLLSFLGLSGKRCGFFWR